MATVVDDEHSFFSFFIKGRLLSASILLTSTTHVKKRISYASMPVCNYRSLLNNNNPTNQKHKSQQVHFFKPFCSIRVAIRAVAPLRVNHVAA